MTLAEKIHRFYKSLSVNAVLPNGVEVMNPYKDGETRKITGTFFRKFYSDNNPRKLLLGINPGRFGAGVTGIPFTDPVKLQENCGIDNDLKKVTEPSAGFIYDMIDAMGGPETFYSNFLIHAVCPLGFVKNGTNYNYYDDKKLEEAVTPFISNKLQEFLKFGFERKICFCLGNGKNYKYLTKLNNGEHFFDHIVALPHPRWIVQYRRKKYSDFIQEYCNTLKEKSDSSSSV